MTVNARGVFLCSVACARYMIAQRGGTIVSVAGATAHRAGVDMGAFGPSKAAVVNLSRQMALEWGPHNIRVNVISPGPVETPGVADKIAENRERILKIPLARVGRIDEIVKGVLFRATDDSSYVNGQELVVDGGGVNTWWLYP